MNYLQLNKQSYNAIAEEFSATRAYVWPDIKLLMNFVKDEDSLLDLGCGNGRVVEVLKDKKVDYLGLDFSEGLIKEAKKKYPDFKFRVADALTFEELKKFDVIFCNSVLNHFPHKYQKKVLANIKKHLKDGGYLLMVNWNMWRRDKKKSVWQTPWSILTRNVLTTWKKKNKKVKLYYYAFTKEELNKLLQRNGFEVVDNFYSLDGEKSSWQKAKNIVSVAKLK